MTSYTTAMNNLRENFTYLQNNSQVQDFARGLSDTFLGRKFQDGEFKRDATCYKWDDRLKKADGQFHNMNLAIEQGLNDGSLTYEHAQKLASELRDYVSGVEGHKYFAKTHGTQKLRGLKNKLNDIDSLLVSYQQPGEGIAQRVQSAQPAAAPDQIPQQDSLDSRVEQQRTYPKIESGITPEERQSWKGVYQGKELDFEGKSPSQIAREIWRGQYTPPQMRKRAAQRLSVSKQLRKNTPYEYIGNESDTVIPFVPGFKPTYASIPIEPPHLNKAEPKKEEGKTYEPKPIGLFSSAKNTLRKYAGYGLFGLAALVGAGTYHYTHKTDQPEFVQPDPQVVVIDNHYDTQAIADALSQRDQSIMDRVAKSQDAVKKDIVDSLDSQFELSKAANKVLADGQTRIGNLETSLGLIGDNLESAKEQVQSTADVLQKYEGSNAVDTDTLTQLSPAYSVVGVQTVENERNIVRRAGRGTTTRTQTVYNQEPISDPLGLGGSRLMGQSVTDVYNAAREKGYGDSLEEFRHNLLLGKVTWDSDKTRYLIARSFGGRN
ncbi:MAG: hypothetical protein ACMXYF_02180 [Candidatus Woesearchaeota archaeon]